MFEFIGGFAVGAILIMITYETLVEPYRIAKEMKKERELMLVKSYDMLIEKLKEVLED